MTYMYRGMFGSRVGFSWSVDLVNVVLMHYRIIRSRLYNQNEALCTIYTWETRLCVSECGAVYNVTEGTIYSPGYPDYYPNNANCTYEIIGDVHKTTIVKFQREHFAVGPPPSSSTRPVMRPSTPTALTTAMLLC